MEEVIARRDFIEKSSKIAAVTGCGILLKGWSTKQEFDIVIKEASFT